MRNAKGKCCLPKRKHIYFEKYQGKQSFYYWIYTLKIYQFMPFQESLKYERSYQKFGGKLHEERDGLVQKGLLQFVLANSTKGNPQEVLNRIDQFCAKEWMMNLGPQKGVIVSQVIAESQPKSILQLGGYCGYSALFMAFRSKAEVHSIQISQHYADIARTIHKHAGFEDRITIHVGVVSTCKQFIQKHGKFDMVFIDHAKLLYLPDLKLLEEYGVVQSGTVVIGDNMIYPGSPDYLEYFKKSEDYSSTFFKSYLQYSDEPDAVLVSKRLH